MRGVKGFSCASDTVDVCQAVGAQAGIEECQWQQLRVGTTTVPPYLPGVG